jgi:hypothetical protein
MKKDRVGTILKKNCNLNGGNVGVDDDSVDALLLERLDGLGAGVVKFPRLPDGQAPRTQDQHLRIKHICASAGKYKNLKTQRHFFCMFPILFSRVFY